MWKFLLWTAKCHHGAAHSFNVLHSACEERFVTYMVKSHVVDDS